jgi:hypothetical protein
MNPARRRLLLAGAAHAAAGCAATVTEPSPTYRVIDLMPAFWAFWAQAQGVHEAARPALFQQMVVSRAPQAYAAPVIGLALDKPYDEELARRYHRVQSLLADRMGLMRTLSDHIAHDLRRYETTFRSAFADLAYRGDIYFMHSLGGFDGGTRRIDGRTALMFGLDMIAYVYGTEADPAPFFHHELFHVYHAQFSAGAESEADTVVHALWREGLATFVAQALNPKASGVSIFGLPATMPARVQADLPRVAQALRTRLDSRDEDDYRRFFLGNQDRDGMPARSGYYIGYLVARELAKRHMLVELAHAPLARLRPEIDKALAAMG